MAMAISITGSDHSRNLRKFSACPSRAAIPATITFAEAAISDPLPPKHDPTDSAHHTGIIASPPPSASPIVYRSGIIVATNGMLSIAADSTADDHKIRNVAF